MGTLNGKVVIITGAARGMGASHAQMAAEEGALVVLTDVLADEGRALADAIGGEAQFLSHDVSVEDDWKQVVDTVVGRFGRVDGLVNNAGILIPKLMLDLSVEEYERVIRINQRSVFLGMKAVALPMAAGGGGSIVNISSIAGLNGSVGTFPYTASKWAVRGMTKAAAQELAASNIRVNSVHPGTVDTPMVQALVPGGPSGGLDRLAGNVPLGQRLARAQEISEMVIFLLSEKSSFCTGSEFVVDGGKSSRLVQ